MSGHVRIHASEHTDGITDPIPEATALLKGLMSTTNWSKLDGIAAGATVYTDLMAVAAMGVKGNGNPLNHDRYTNGEAVTACSGTYEPIISPKNSAFNVSFETSTANIKMNGSVSVGALSTVARADHIHATDTSRAASSHTHAPTDVTGTAIIEGDARLTNARTPTAHTHAATDINSGTLDGARLPAMSVSAKGGVPATGTPSGLFLKDDGTWAAGGSTDSNAFHKTTAAEISALATEKTLPVDADWLLLESVADSNAKRKVQVSNIAGQSDLTFPIGNFITSTPATSTLSIEQDGTTRLYYHWIRNSGTPTVSAIIYTKLPTDFKSFATNPVEVMQRRVGTITTSITMYRDGSIDATLNGITAGPTTSWAKATFTPGSTYAAGEEILLIITATLGNGLQYDLAYINLIYNRKVR